MGDASLPITGKDVRVALVFNGAVQAVADQITEFTEEAKYDEIDTKIIGEDGMRTDNVFLGWGGQITFAQNGPELESFVDAYNFAIRNRIPVLINITRTNNYRDGTSQTRTYPDCKVGWGARARRASVREITLPWRTGQDRF